VRDCTCLLLQGPPWEEKEMSRERHFKGPESFLFPQTKQGGVSFTFAYRCCLLCERSTIQDIETTKGRDRRFSTHLSPCVFFQRPRPKSRKGE